MTCTTCGNENEHGRFCTKCGSSLAAGDLKETVIGPTPQIADTSIVGRTVEGRYHIDSVLDQGGMGIVYRATRVMIGDVVALKVLHGDRVADNDSRERFRREAQAAARLKHPNAVAIYDFGVTSDGLVYLVMELADGESLAKIIKRRGALPAAESVEIIRQVAAAVGEAHRHNIIHRDLKPDNVIVSGSGSVLQVKVLDFGIAKLKDVGGSTLTQTGTVVGTPYYMSPEQCLGEDLDGRSDIYSLGVVLFEMLTGKVPFTAPTPTAVVVQQVTQPAPSPRASNPAISLSIERVVMRALEKKRDARPATVEQFYQELSVAAAAQGAGSAPTEVAPAAANKSAQPAPSANQTATSGGPTATYQPSQQTYQTGGQPPSHTVGQYPPGPPSPGYPPAGQPGYGQYPGRPSGPQQAPAPNQGYAPGSQPPGAQVSWAGPQYPTSQPTAYAPAAASKSRGGLYMVIGFVGLVVVVLAITVGYLAATSHDERVDMGGSVTANPSPTPSQTPAGQAATPLPSSEEDSDAVIAEVNNTLNGWAQAITSQDMNLLMNFYADTLRPYYNLSSAPADRIRSDMMQAFSQYSITIIQVSNVSVQPAPDGEHAVATFDKTFDFSGAKKASGAVQEQISFVKMNGHWVIAGVRDLQTY